ncbi:MAG: IS1380 family transposase, partial [bacterium]|nr:IS1380 family transposase [bacterium]
MQTQCIPQQIKFEGLGRRQVIGDFDAGRVSSDGGALILRELDLRTGIVERFSECFTDHRNPELIEHGVLGMLRQRVYALCLGYEDLNDHDTLRDDALFATAVGKLDPTGAKRTRERDRGHALAGKSTLNQLELTPRDASSKSRYKKIVAREEDVECFFVDEFIDAHKYETPPCLILDIDPSDIELHGNQEERFYHGYYDNYCYLPLYIFCGSDLLMARLRSADRDGCDGTVEALARLVPALRAQWPEVELVLRADSGFAREDIFAWCEGNNVEYVIGLAGNSRLKSMISYELDFVRERQALIGGAVRQFEELRYQTLKTWSRERRVVAKVEQLPGKSNPRFVVTSLNSIFCDARELYEDLYCQRGEAENRIKEHQLDLFGDRASSSKMRGNQLRVWLSAVAYTLMNELRRTALVDTPLERAQTSTIRTRLLKIGALIYVSARRIRIKFSSVF